MKAIQDSVAAYLQESTGVRTVADRTRARGEYPLLAVSVREDGTVLVDGGRQAEHTYRVTVSAASDREREVNTALLSSLTPILLRGVPMGERTLHPLEVKTEGETLTFTVELCVPLAQPEKPPWSRRDAWRLSIWTFDKEIFEIWRYLWVFLKFLSAFRRRLCPPSPVPPGACWRWR